jgi:hypothetical protein
MAYVAAVTCDECGLVGPLAATMPLALDAAMAMDWAKVKQPTRHLCSECRPLSKVETRAAEAFISRGLLNHGVSRDECARRMGFSVSTLREILYWREVMTSEWTDEKCTSLVPRLIPRGA